MPELRLNFNAAATLRALFADPTKDQLVERIEESLDQLETNPADTKLTRKEFQSPEGLLYGIRVSSGSDDWIILWQFEGDAVSVRYLGPSGSL